MTGGCDNVRPYARAWRAYYFDSLGDRPIQPTCCEECKGIFKVYTEAVNLRLQRPLP